MKHKIITLLCLCLVLGLASCKKTVSVSSSEVSGVLEGAFEVKEGDYEVETDDDGNSIIKVEIKRTDNSVPYTSALVKPFSYKGDKAATLAGFGFVEKDAKGKDINEVNAAENDYDEDNQIEILTLKEGKKGELVIKLSGELPASLELTSAVSLVRTGNIELFGSVGKYATKNWTMDFNFKDNKNEGKYQYATSPAGAYLYLNGHTHKKSDKEDSFDYTLNFVENNGHGTTSADFSGTISLKRSSPTSPYQYFIEGNFINSRGQSFYTSLKSSPLE